MVALRLWPKQHLRVASFRFSAYEQQKKCCEAEYCDKHACLCVYLSIRDHIFGTTRPIFADFTHVTHSRESVLLWRRSKLRTSGFMDNVICAHKPRLLDVAAQLKRSAHAALGLVTNRG